MGAKSSLRRNFEAGMVATVMDQFDRVWMGAHCAACGRHEFCTEYDLLQATETGRMC